MIKIEWQRAGTTRNARVTKRAYEVKANMECKNNKERGNEYGSEK